MDREKLINLDRKKNDLKLKLEEETNNFREDVLTNPVLYINVLEANNLEMNGDIFVKIFCGAQIYTTQIIKNSRNPIWNESYKMFNLFFSNFYFCKAHFEKGKGSPKSD